MRRTLGTLLLTTLLLAGCGGGGSDGGGGGDRADDPAPSSTDEPSESPANDWRLVGIVHATAVGGEVSPKAKPVGDAAAVAAFSAPFADSALQRQIQRVVDRNQPAPGDRLVAAVVAVGCDVPTAVTYDGSRVRAMKVADPTPECFAAVTSVAILEVPA